MDTDIFRRLSLVTSLYVIRVRTNLEREGKGPDMSDGEWAAVQLELIRQVNGHSDVPCVKRHRTLQGEHHLPRFFPLLLLYSDGMDDFEQFRWLE